MTNPVTDEPTELGYQHPRDPIELWLARQWQDVLGFGVGVTEHFFRVGGNSLDAARVVNAILDEFGVQLPLNVLTDHPTVADLADQLRGLNERLPGPLLLIQRGDGTRPPLFLVHPDSGQLGGYAPLAHALGEDHTVFGLQAPGLYTDTEPLRTVPDLAGAYLDAIRATAGPCLLAGCAVGAAVAHELAAQLTEAGAEVRLLAVIDAELLAPDTGDSRARQANQDALRDWQPRPYTGPLTVFGNPAPFAAWSTATHRSTVDFDGLADALGELIR